MIINNKLNVKLEAIDTNDDRMKQLLFPYQDLLRGKVIAEDKNHRKFILSMRVKVINKLCKFMLDSGRFGNKLKIY